MASEAARAASGGVAAPQRKAPQPQYPTLWSSSVSATGGSQPQHSVTPSKTSSCTPPTPGGAGAAAYSVAYKEICLIC